MADPWECPRCRAWHAPTSLKCDCEPIKPPECNQCIADAFAIFNAPFPSLDVIYSWANSFHRDYCKEKEIK